MSTDVEDIILRSFFTKDEFMRKVVPFMEPDYFNGVNRDLFKVFCQYVSKYNSQPTIETYQIALQNSKMSDNDLEKASQIIPSLFQEVEIEDKWLLDLSLIHI